MEILTKSQLVVGKEEEMPGCTVFGLLAGPARTEPAVQALHLQYDGIPISTVDCAGLCRREDRRWARFGLCRSTGYNP